MTTKQEDIEKLTKLAMDIKSENVDIDWSQVNMTKEDAFVMMAGNVVEQFYSLDEEVRYPVALATITKLLVENLALTVKTKNIN